MAVLIGRTVKCMLIAPDSARTIFRVIVCVLCLMYSENPG